MRTTKIEAHSRILIHAGNQSSKSLVGYNKTNENKRKRSKE